MTIGILVVELPDVLRPQLLGVGGIDDTGPDLDDEVPARTQELRVTPRASDAVGIAFESAFVVTYGVVGIKQRGGDELSDVSLDEPVPTAAFMFPAAHPTILVDTDENWAYVVEYADIRMKKSRKRFIIINCFMRQIYRKSIY